MDTRETVESVCRELGLDHYEEAGSLLGQLVIEKRKQYGGGALERSSAVLTLLYPDGIQPDQYPDAMSIMRVVEKLSRIAGGNQGDENAWVDIAGHGMVAGAISERRL